MPPPAFLRLWGHLRVPTTPVGLASSMSDKQTQSAPDRATDVSTLRNRLVSAGAAFGFLGVVLGAFGAHALSTRLDARALEIFETAVRYHLIHAVALVALAGIADWNARAVRLAGRLFVAGILIFAGSLYGVALSGVGVLGAVTPVGGVCFLAGWAALVWGTVRSAKATD